MVQLNNNPMSEARRGKEGERGGRRAGGGGGGGGDYWEGKKVNVEV